ncbi:SDR family oxidoreductase [Reyranella sp. CPCC 100927]|uniref:SDR family oxidoreductase n=1 Tax=Reyranella sp. CPCC 100927 TaxID=2599616 RepID=UPI0011B41D75|nr:SDR family oxidoreductase [Reyranella sp. CPCC 100927]TWS96175.1 SDR family oxidoreductase [Reyranella sp. CPCC 100927]
MDLNGYRVAVVTGANRGIGAALVRALRQRGLEVHAIARSAGTLAELAQATGCVPHALDVGDRAAIAAALDGLAVDVLVNNAAAVATGGPSFETTAAQMDALLRVNIAGVVNALAAVVPGMKARGRGHIVNLGSTAGHHPIPGMPAYAMTKAAIHNLSQTLRLDLHGSGIRVSEIVPGRVETGIHLGLMEDRAAAQRLFYDDVVSLQPEDIAAAILFVLGAPQRMDVTLMEVMPTDSVNGGTAFAKRPG